VVADSLDLMHALVLDNQRRWGELAIPAQRRHVRAVLQPAPGSPTLYWDERPKGCGKTTDTAALSIVWLVELAPELAEGYVVASDADQATRLLAHAHGLIARSGLSGVLRVEARRVVNVRTGARFVALAADAPGAEGLLSPWFVCDELPRWSDTRSARAMWNAVFSSVPKWTAGGGAKLLVLGHAGDPSHWSFKLRERARASPAWWFQHVPGPTPWLSPADLEEQRAVLLPSEYARRHLNIWQAGEDRLASREDIAECVGGYDVLEPRSGARYVAGLDVGLTNDRTVVTVAHREADGRVVVDRQDVWQGSRARPVNLSDVEGFLRELWRAYRCPFRVDPFQAVHLAQRLRAAGIPVEEFTFSSQSVGRLAVTLYRLLADRLLLLPDDEDLVDELVNVRLRETAPGQYRIDHDPDKHDDRVISLALVAHRLAERPARMQGRFDLGAARMTMINSGPIR
jgi:hypothetical protein